MKRHVSHYILSAVILAILLIPTTTTLSQDISDRTELVEPTMKKYDYADYRPQQCSGMAAGMEP